MKNQKTILVIFLLFISIVGCSSEEEPKIEWTDLQILCANWDYEPYTALRLKIILGNSVDTITQLKFRIEFDDELYILPLEIQSTKVINNQNMLLAVLDSRELPTSFLEGLESEEDCGEKALANLAGGGSLCFSSSNKLQEVEKSPKFSFYIGLKND